MDVAITAKRLGAPNVRMVCLEQRDGMPANEEEVTRALEEGVEIINGWVQRKFFTRTARSVESLFKNCPKVSG